jgi:uncharacterized protein (TIGR03437 family)
VLAWNYDAAVADPHITAVVNSADRSTGVAPGSLISVLGTDLSPVNIATNQTPLPTVLGDSCLTVNGVLVPLIFVSPTQINGQLPFTVSGTGSMILHTPAGVSNTFTFPILGGAPAVFLVNVPGWDGLVPAVVRADNGLLVTPSNPIHLNDVWIIIYLTGLGLTTPDIAAGEPGTSDPLVEAQNLPVVTLDGVQLLVAFAGLAPGQVGVFQINARIPFHGVQTGMQIPLTITQGTFTTTLYVRVVE